MSFVLFAAAATSAVAVNASGANAVQPPINSCLNRAGELSGKNSTLPLPIAGSEIKSVRQFNKAIRNIPYRETAVIEGGDFSGWKMGTKWSFGSRYLQNICFVGTKLAQTDWTEAKTSGMGFINVDLTDSLMDQAEMPYVLFRNTTLKGVEANEADWSDGQLDGGWNNSISDLQIEEADLSGFRFVCGANETNGCPFERKNINARRANLTNASILGFSVLDADFTQARIEGIEIGVNQLDQLKGAVALGPVRLRGGPFGQIASAQEFNALRATQRTPGYADARCDAPTDPLQVALCGDPTRQLLQLDDDITLLTTGNVLGKSKAKAYTKGRQKCLKQKNNLQVECFTKALVARRDELVSGQPLPAWSQRPGAVIFARSDLATDKDPISAALWSRFGTVIVGSAAAYMAVEVKAPGKISVRGKATGADNEFCHFNVENLSYEAGVFRLPSASIAAPAIEYDRKGKAKKPKKIKKGKPELKVAFAFFYGDSAQLTPNQNDQSVFVDGGLDTSKLVRCNGPVTFGKMKQLEVDQSAFDTIWDGTATAQF